MVRWPHVCLSLATLLVCVASGGRAEAHDPFEITTQGSIRSDSLILVVTMAPRSAARLAQPEAGGAAPLTAEILRRDRAQFEAAAERFYDVTAASLPLRCRTTAVTFTADNDVQFRITYDGPKPGPLRLHAKYLEGLADGYSNGVNLTQQFPPMSSGLRFLSRDEPTLEVHVLPNLAESAASRATDSRAIEFRRFFGLGMHHLFTGYDHLLFLAALLVAAGSLSSMLAVVTAFTVAHSVTLALASLDVYTLPGSVVEPLIAASIVAVALENLLFPQSKPWRRLLATLAFGLIHGFGFASVLRELGLAGDGLTSAARLFAFNLGIEVAQVAIAVPVWLGLVELRRRNWIDGRAVRGTSVAIAVLGGYWFLERVIAA